MTTRRTAGRAVVELLLAALAAAGTVWSWLNVRAVVDVAPITGGEPATTSTVYDPSLLVLTLALATVAGVLAVLAVARLWRTGNPLP